MHKKDQGTYGEQLVIAQCLKNGMTVFQEIGDNSKVDIIVMDNSGGLHKVQIKCYGREKAAPDATMLYLTKSGPNYKYKYTTEDLDWFAVVDYETDKIMWVFMDDIKDISQLTFRHKPAKNKLKVRMFDDYIDFPFD